MSNAWLSSTYIFILRALRRFLSALTAFHCAKKLLMAYKGLTNHRTLFRIEFFPCSSALSFKNSCSIKIHKNIYQDCSWHNCYNPKAIPTFHAFWNIWFSVTNYSVSTEVNAAQLEEMLACASPGINSYIIVHI